MAYHGVSWRFVAFHGLVFTSCCKPVSHERAAAFARPLACALASSRAVEQFSRRPSLSRPWHGRIVAHSRSRSRSVFRRPDAISPRSARSVRANDSTHESARFSMYWRVALANASPIRNHLVSERVEPARRHSLRCRREGTVKTSAGAETRAPIASGNERE